ncbi:YlbF family regulator [Alicyclobacillus macrosporangiidus]|uniref:YlbF family regulator n=1 Tax=Alicyclobacillus macrosporangiidus TaxID=392015 RepID=UPI000496182B|nr:YlbF family regulator [Alicyclobacillus macrosporangiidus]MCL6597288.1 YlbF family regulator [Alicyclobacillus macrosporangiidus]
MSRDALLRKADEIARMIGCSDAAVRFWKARAKMENNRRAQQLFETLKLKTNNSLGLQAVFPADHPRVRQLDEEIAKLEHELYEIPVAMQYKEAQAELNELMQGVVQLLLNRLSDRVPVERGPRLGCGQGPNGTGCTCGERD